MIGDAVQARLTGAGIDTYLGRPTSTPPSDYVIVSERAPLTAPRRRLSDAANDSQQVTVTAVSRDRGRCAALTSRVLALLTGWRPAASTATSPLRRYDATEPLPDGPPSDVRYSQVMILRCTTPPPRPTSEGPPL